MIFVPQYRKNKMFFSLCERERDQLREKKKDREKQKGKEKKKKNILLSSFMSNT